VIPDTARIGSVPYLNAVPLTCGLEGRCSFLPPSTLAVELRAGRLEAALLSVTEALFAPGYPIVDGVAIASDGPVFSVFLAHQDPLDERLTEVHLDPASCTSVNLLRVLLAARGLSPRFSPLADYDRERMPRNVLLIGDPAIRFSLGPHPHQIWDLGAAWQEWTGLPFVYAVWAVREAAATPALANGLRAAREQGVNAMAHWVEHRPEFTREFRQAYLGGHIRYGLGDREKAGLECFRQALDTHIHPRRPTVVPRYI
jgi:predicted solute-binding protein